MSAYSFFAKYYDELTQNVEYAKRADYFSALLLSCGIDGGTVLDLACGTGSMTVELAERGYDMVGVDMSVDMLSFAQNKAFENKANILFLCQKMQDLHLYSKADAVICTLDSINHLTNEKDVQKTFNSVANNLRSGGVFIFDVNTVYKHRCVLSDNCFIYEYPDVFCAWQNSYNEKDNSVDITLDFFENRGGKYQRFTEIFSERAYEVDTLISMLERSGFEVLNIFEELSRSELKENSQRAVIVARCK